MHILASFIQKRPWLIIILVILITLFLGYMIRYLDIEADISKALPSDLPEVHYFDKVNEIFPKQEFFIVGMISDKLFSVEMIDKLDRLTRDFEKIDGVGQVLSPVTVDTIVGTADGLEVSPILPSLPETAAQVEAFRKAITTNKLYKDTFISADQRAAIILLQVKDGDKREAILHSIKDYIAQNNGGPETYRISGEAATLTEIKDIIIHDILLLSPIVLGVILLSLYLSFRTLRGVVLPLLTVIISVIWALGIMAILHVPLSIMTTVVPTILIAIGSAYGIHIISRFSLELKADKGAAITQTIHHTGLAVLMAGLTTMAGFLSFLSSRIQTIREFGLFTAIGVVCALFFSMTFIPALLYLMPIPRKTRWNTRAPGEGRLGRILTALGKSANRRSMFFLLGALAIFAVSLAGMTQLRVESDLVQMFGKHTKVMEDNEFFNKEFSGTMTMQVVFEGEDADAMKSPDVLRAMESIQHFVGQSPIVGSSQSLADMIAEMNRVMIGGAGDQSVIPDSRKLISQYLLLYSLTGSDESLENLVTYDFSQANLTVFLKSGNLTELNRFEQSVRTYINNNIHLDGISIHLTGRMSTMGVLSNLIVQSQLLSIGISLILVLLITTFIFRSIIMGLISIVPIIVTIVLNFGLMGWVGIPLDLATVLIASVSIGIGIDYSIHYINHYKTERLAGKPVLDAIISTNTITGKAILLNALAVGAGFLVLILSSMASIGVLGGMIALTMFVSSAGAMLIIPAIFSLIEKRKFFQRLLFLGTPGVFEDID